MSQDRRNDYDVTNTVQVSDPVSVRNAVYELFSATFPGASYDKIWLAFYDFERLFTGRFPGYKGCDTTYHDLQHTLDMTLALARLVAGYERSVEQKDRLGALRGVQAGDLITEKTAPRWSATGSDKCSCCETESLHHRWWSCPKI